VWREKDMHSERERDTQTQTKNESSGDNIFRKITFYSIYIVVKKLYTYFIIVYYFACSKIIE
jgi:hypothetical protein